MDTQDQDVTLRDIIVAITAVVLGAIALFFWPSGVAHGLAVDGYRPAADLLAAVLGTGSSCYLISMLRPS